MYRPSAKLFSEVKKSFGFDPEMSYDDFKCRPDAVDMMMQVGKRMRAENPYALISDSFFARDGGVYNKSILIVDNVGMWEDHHFLTTQCCGHNYVYLPLILAARPKYHKEIAIDGMEIRPSASDNCDYSAFYTKMPDDKSRINMPAFDVCGAFNGCSSQKIHDELLLLSHAAIMLADNGFIRDDYIDSVSGTMDEWRFNDLLRAPFFMALTGIYAETRAGRAKEQQSRVYVTTLGSVIGHDDEPDHGPAANVMAS